MPTSHLLTRRPAQAPLHGVAAVRQANAQAFQAAQAHAPAEVQPPSPLSAMPCWPSQDLLGPGVEALIRHGDSLYRLRLTRQGKLILTK